MPVISVFLDGDGCWPDLTQLVRDGKIIDAMGNNSGTRLQMALLPGGMVSGSASITIRIDLPDGRTVLTETSLAVLRSAVQAFDARLEYLKQQKG